MRHYPEIERRLAEIEERGLRRSLVEIEPIDATRGRLGNQEVHLFCTNDYLGLAELPEMRAAWSGAGCGSSRLISGTRPAHRALEDALAERFGDRALVFSSGYQANLALLSTLFGPGDRVASDRLAHASLIDGLKLSRAEVEIVPHGEPSPNPTGLRGVVLEGLYSMDGDKPDLSRYEGHGWRVIDEAHAVGCLGPEGRGVAADQGLVPDALVDTLGKAYGAAGAFVVGPEPLIELLVSRGRSFIYTTALAEPAARAAQLGISLATSERREQLAERVCRFRQGLADLGLPTSGQDHVVPLLSGEKTMALSQQLLDCGYYVPGIRAPTVAPGQERLRFSLSAAHTDDQIDGVLEVLARCC